MLLAAGSRRHASKVRLFVSVARGNDTSAIDTIHYYLAAGAEPPSQIEE